jgi:site-specific DNA recombinase
MRSIGYIRVSTENQVGEDAFGLETQRAAISKYCLDQDIELVEIYEDPAISGSTDSWARPGLGAALGVLQGGGIDKVVVYKLDRLARDLYLTLWLEKEIRKFGAEVVSVTEPYRWDYPTQKLLLNIIMSFCRIREIAHHL